jgi:hypothetical protein
MLCLQATKCNDVTSLETPNMKKREPVPHIFNLLILVLFQVLTLSPSPYICESSPGPNHRSSLGTPPPPPLLSFQREGRALLLRSLTAVRSPKTCGSEVFYEEVERERQGEKRGQDQRYWGRRVSN